MDHLPAEILAKIFQHLSNDDIFNLPYRLSAKGLSDTEGQCRFSQHRTWIEKESLQNLTRVTRHPKVRKYVTELIFCHEMPQEMTLELFLEYWKFIHGHGTEEDWPMESQTPLETPRVRGLELTLENFHDLMGIPGNSYACYRRWPSLSQRWIDHKSTLTDLQKLLADNEVIEILLRAFQRLENIDIVSIDNVYRGMKERQGLGLRYFIDHPSYEYPTRFTGDFMISHDNRVFEILTEVLAISNSRPRSFRIIGDTDNWVRHHQTRSVALSLASISIWSSPVVARIAFRDVRKMELRGLWYSGNFLHDGQPEDDEEFPVTQPEQALSTILRSATSLEELTVHFSDFHSKGFIDDIPLSKLPKSNRFRHLKKLDLAHFGVRPKKLTAFLKSLAKTLASLSLEHVVLQGYWESVFDDLKGVFQLDYLRLSLLITQRPHAPVLHGESRRFVVPYQAGGDDEALAWLCGRSDVNPFRRNQPSA